MLERHINRHSPDLVLRSKLDEQLIVKFILPGWEQLRNDFRCNYNLNPTGIVHGRLYVFSGHLCFAGGVLTRLKGRETILVIPLRGGDQSVINMERQAACRALASAIILSTLGQDFTFSGFAQPDIALKTMLDVWQVSNRRTTCPNPTHVLTQHMS